MAIIAGRCPRALPALPAVYRIAIQTNLKRSRRGFLPAQFEDADGLVGTTFQSLPRSRLEPFWSPVVGKLDELGLRFLYSVGA